jgi:hypothetical protein
MSFILHQRAGVQEYGDKAVHEEFVNYTIEQDE